MRNTIFFMMIAWVVAGCQEIDLKPYSGKDTIQFYSSDYSKEPSKEYFWAAALDPFSDYDTCWLTVQTVGHASPVDRRIELVQEVAKGWNLTYDLVGNVVDSVAYVIADQAVVGKHYVPFDEPGLKPLLKIPANAYTAMIPIVMKRDPDMIKKQTLKVRLVNTEDVIVGDPQFTCCTITIE